MTISNSETRAYVLHVRSYTDSRVIVEFFTQQHGRLGMVARLSKKNKAQFQPFVPAHIQYFGKSELKTLTDVDVLGVERFILTGKLSFCGLYVNELLLRLLPAAESFSESFRNYEQCLANLSKADTLHVAEQFLRAFEFDFLRELGYGLDFNCSSDGHPIVAEQFYSFKHEVGFKQYDGTANLAGIKGRDIINIGASNYSSASTLKAAKFLSRESITPLLAGKPLKSRELFS